jgi:hypothetical protein
VAICPKCVSNPQCFMCGLPTYTNRTELPDGRVLCPRDAQTAVLNADDGVRTCRETRDQLDRLFSRFLVFPSANVTVAIVDRVNLQTLFKFPGNDRACPNVWGYIITRTNHARLEHEMSILSALPLDSFKATCAHEYGHAWLNENLSPARKRILHQDAIEGFCELISYSLMDEEHAEPQKKLILLNNYTRGQIQLFLEAQERYGFNELLDWMKYGRDARLDPENLGRLRTLDVPRYRTVLAQTNSSPSPAEPTSPQPDLVLKGIFLNKQRPLAIINNRTFGVNEEGKVRVGTSNLTVRCLAIEQDSVRIRIIGTGEERELTPLKQ